ncbi:recombination protein NinG [Kluyvera ascorbata]|uniref:recombination protein NinG n=1 Tax=Kluyvera ascorbata TaxID=51288 RepID=UPI003CCC8D09
MQTRCRTQLSNTLSRSPVGGSQTASVSANPTKRTGPERVEALENNNTPHRYTIEELEAIRKRYSALRRGLIKSREAA